MNYSVCYSNKDFNDIASETWPDLLTLVDSYPSVPQSTHPGEVFAPGYPTVGSYALDFNATDPYPSVPQSDYPGQVLASGYPTIGSSDFNAVDYAVFSLPPVTDMVSYANLPLLDLQPQADFTNLSCQSVGTSTWT